MYKLALRDYNREIDGWIMAGQVNLAIQHCRYIMKAFPKHVHTYRSLGRAYIESQYYQEAADIFLRLLSSLPDDLVAHIGLSAIREGEGQIAGAIWHMERAFEVQPGSETLQQELGRLYAMQTGWAADKTRLTHGALARMYYIGKLYPQAIAELQIARQAVENQFHLDVWLASSYADAGQHQEAIALSWKILDKLPYCLEANRILAFSSQGIHHPPEVDRCWQHLKALDPYFAFTSLEQPVLEKIPDQAVTLDKME